MGGKGSGRKTATITARIGEPVRDAIQAQATKEYRTISQQVALVLGEYVRKLQTHS